MLADRQTRSAGCARGGDDDETALIGHWPRGPNDRHYVAYLRTMKPQLRGMSWG